MKIEMMEFLSDKITDINLLKKLILALDKMSSNNLKRFLDELKRSDYNEYICKMMIDLNEGKDVLIVGHGAMNSSIVCQIRNLPLSKFWDAGIENCKLMKLK